MNSQPRRQRAEASAILGFAAMSSGRATPVLLLSIAGRLRAIDHKDDIRVAHFYAGSKAEAVR